MDIATYLLSFSFDREIDPALAHLMDQLVEHLGDQVQVLHEPHHDFTLVRTRDEEYFTREELMAFIATRASNPTSARARAGRLWNIYARDVPVGDGYVIRCRYCGVTTTSQRCQGPSAPFHNAEAVWIKSVKDLHRAFMRPEFKGASTSVLKQDADAFVQHLP